MKGSSWLFSMMDSILFKQEESRQSIDLSMRRFFSNDSPFMLRFSWSSSIELAPFADDSGSSSAVESEMEILLQFDSIYSSQMEMFHFVPSSSSSSSSSSMLMVDDFRSIWLRNCCTSFSSRSTCKHVKQKRMK